LLLARRVFVKISSVRNWFLSQNIEGFLNRQNMWWGDLSRLVVLSYKPISTTQDPDYSSVGGTTAGEP
jgi:hypothetical protein